MQIKKPLTDYIYSAEDISVLNDMFLTEEGFLFQNIEYVLEEITPAEYIGVKTREKARENKINEITKENNEISSKKQHIKDNELLELKNKLNIVNNNPSKSNLKNIENQKNFVERDLQKINENIEQLQSNLNNMNIDTATHVVFNTYEYNELAELYHEYIDKKKDKERSEEQKIKLEKDLLKNKNSQEKITKKINTEKEELEQELALRKQLEEEIEELENNDDYIQLEKEKQQLEEEIKRIKTAIDGLNGSLGGYTTQEQYKNNEIMDAESKLEKDTKEYTETNQIIKELLENNLDNYETDKFLRNNLKVLEDFHIDIKPAKYQYNKLPKTSFSDELNRMLKLLEYPVIRNTSNNIDEDFADYMNKIKSEIENQRQITNKLYQVAKSALVIEVFKHLPKVSKEVERYLSRLKVVMERNKESMLRTFVEYELKPEHHNKLEIIEDIEEQNKLIDKIEERIYEYLRTTEENEADIPSIIIEKLFEELEPSSWYDVTFKYTNNNKPIAPLTTEATSTLSTGERVRVFYTPMLALAEIMKEQMNPNAPFMIMIDEGFPSLDDTQFKFLLNYINSISDLFLITCPKGGIPMAENTKSIKTVLLTKKELPNGEVVTYSNGNDILEEIIDE
jgi:viral A-type inclusion protein, putative